MAEGQSDEEGGASSDDEQARKPRKAPVRTDRLQVLGGGYRRGIHLFFLIFCLIVIHVIVFEIDTVLQNLLNELSDLSLGKVWTPFTISYCKPISLQQKDSYVKMYI